MGNEEMEKWGNEEIAEYQVIPGRASHEALA